jgi:hypothetical protein
MVGPVAQDLDMTTWVTVFLAFSVGCGDSGGDCAESVYACEVKADTPLAYWRLGDVATPAAVDASGQAHDGLYMGAVQLGSPGALSGDPDSAATFDGATTFVIAGDIFDFAGTAAMSVEAWVRPTVTDDASRGIVAKEGGSPPQGWALSLRQGTVSFQRFRDGAIESVDGGAIPEDRYSHVVVTYDEVTMRLYVNGGLVGSAAGTLSLIDHLEPLALGARDSGRVIKFAGDLDEVAVYGEALSSTRIEAHSTKALDQTR